MHAICNAVSFSLLAQLTSAVLSKAGAGTGARESGVIFVALKNWATECTPPNRILGSRIASENATTCVFAEQKRLHTQHLAAPRKDIDLIKSVMKN